MINLPLVQYWRLLIVYLRPQWRMALLLAALLLTNIGLQMLSPQILRHFIDTAQAGGASAVLLRAALLFMAAVVVQQLVAVLSTYMGENVGWTATNAMRDALLDHCLRLDISFHKAHTPGEMIERIDGDVTALSNFFSQFVVMVLGNAILLAGVLLLLFMEDWRIGLPLSLFVLLALFVLLRFGDIAVPHWAAERQASADLFGFLEERLAGSEDIRANGAKAHVLRHFFQLMRTQMQKSLRASLMVNLLLNTSLLLFAVGTAIAFAVGTLLYRAQAITLGTVYMVFYYTVMLEHPIFYITEQMQDVQKAGAGIARVRELFDVRSKMAPVDAQAAQTLPGGPLAVVFRDVTFGYDDAPAAGESADRPPDKEMVLHELSFSLAPGIVLGLLGRTGSGKTTLARLLFRLYDPDAGSVCLGDGAALVDIRRVPASHLCQRVGMVTQTVQLFHATLRDNLTLFDSTVPDERVRGVIGELGLTGWLQSLPQGLDTLLESGGGGLAAGEAQLLAFTRIFLQDPGVVILDEASSRLDPATERLVEQAVDRLVRGRTAIIIAHRLSTVLRADEIMIMEDGWIGEHGLRSVLMADPRSRFSHLLQTGLQEVLA